MRIIGVGNEYRRDDAAGLIAARRLRARGVEADEHTGDLATLMERWSGADDLILIDAVRSGAVPAGTLHRLDVSRAPLPRELFRSSTHALGLAEAVELSRALGTLPGRVTIYGIEAHDFAPRVGLSADVERAVATVVDDVARVAAAPRTC